MAHQRWLCFDHLTLQIWDTATKQMWLRVPKVLSDTFKVTWMPGGIRVMMALVAIPNHGHLHALSHNP